MADIPVFKLSSKPPVSGKAVRLLLVGFAKQSVVSVDEILAALDVLPPDHLVDLTAIEYDPLFTTPDELSYYESRLRLAASGKYVAKDRTILMHRFVSRPLFLRMLYHEIGHFVFSRVIDSYLRKEWVTELHPGSEHVTEYAARNAGEDFAESYASYVIEPERLRRLGRKFAFMREKVFQGVVPRRASTGETPLPR